MPFSSKKRRKLICFYHSHDVLCFRFSRKSFTSLHTPSSLQPGPCFCSASGWLSAGGPTASITHPPLRYEQRLQLCCWLLSGAVTRVLSIQAHYCILTGWNNGWMDKLLVWRRAEAMVYRCNGQEPNCWKDDPSLKSFALAL